MRTLLAVASGPVFGSINGISLRQAILLPLLRQDWHVVLASPDRPGQVDPSAADDHASIPALRRWNPCPDREEWDNVRTVIWQALESLRPDAMLLWPGAEHVVFQRSPSCTVVSDRIDAMTLSAWRDLRRLRLRARRHHLTTLGSFAAYERRVVGTSWATAVVGEDDARVLRMLGGRDVHVISNGVHVPQTMTPAPVSGPPVIAFTGVMSFPPNIEAVLDFARHAWPAVRARHPSARFVVAGRSPAPEILALSGVAGIEVMPDVASMSDVLREAWLCVAPMRTGTGVKNKVLEAWAEGRPVVMTAMAANGLATSAANSSLIVDTAVEMARQVCWLVESPRERAALGSALQAHARYHHRWDTAAYRFSDLLSSGARKARLAPRAVRNTPDPQARQADLPT